MLEKDIEKRLVQGIKKCGGLCYKFVSPGNVGVPDRIVILPGGRVVFVELKTDAGILSPLQVHRIDEIRKRGGDARVLRGLSAVNDFLKEGDA